MNINIMILRFNQYSKLSENVIYHFENKLPKKIQGEISIPKGIYHRVIKGSGDLEIELIKL
jgi:hypothetical protein